MWIREQTAIISLHSINWLVFVSYVVHGECLLRGTFYILRSAHTAFYMLLVCTWEQTAIISLYNIDWLVFITDAECVYCAVRTDRTNDYKFDFPS